MANIFEILDPNKKLPESRTIEGLSDKIGAPVAPITPVAAAEIGANKDQVKMAGTGQQVAGAIGDISVAPTTAPALDYGTAKRRQQVRRQMTEEEKQQALGISQVASDLGTFKNDLITAFNDIQTFGNVAAFDETIDDEKIKGLNPDIQAKAIEILNKFIDAEPESRERYLAMREFEELTDQTISGGGFITGGDVGELVAGAIPPDLKVSQLNMQVDPATLDALQLTQEQFNDLTAGELQRRITSRLQDEEFQQIDQLQEMLQDPTIPANERLMIRQRLTEMGAVGLRATEEELDKVLADIEQEVSFEINGESYTIEEILKDDYLSELISEYALNPEESRSLDNLPALKEYINNNLNAYKDIAEKVAAEQEGFDQLQDDLQTALQGTLPDQVALNSSIMQELFGDEWDIAFSQDKIEQVKNNPIIQILHSDEIDDTQKKNYIDNLNTIKEKYPNIGMMQWFGDMSIEELSKSGVLSGLLEDNGSVMTKIRKVSEFKKNPNDASMLVGDQFRASPDGTITSYITQLRKANALGSTEAKNLLQILDSDGDGNISVDDDLSAIIQTDQDFWSQNLNGILTRVQSLGIDDLAADGQLTPEELINTGYQRWSNPQNDTREIFKQLNELGPAAKPALDRIIREVNDRRHDIIRRYRAGRLSLNEAQGQMKSYDIYPGHSELMWELNRVRPYLKIDNLDFSKPKITLPQFRWTLDL